MKTIRNILLASTAVILTMIGDAPPDARFGFQLMSEAQAIFGVRRRSFRRGVIVGASVGAAGAYSATASQQQSATAQQQSATAQQQSATAQQQAATAQQSAAVPPPADTSKPLPQGTVVPSLPKGCTSAPSGGVEYYHCGSNYYRAVFQGNSLVYVTAKP